jgi:peptide subunit release factor 1 (eRF1)
MLTRFELEQLASYRSADFLITSLYLNFDKDRPDESKAQIRLKNMLAVVETQCQCWSRAQVESVNNDLERIRGFVRDQVVHGGQSVVIFSSSGASFWQTYTFPQTVGNHLCFDHQPHIKPLVRWLAQQEPICTILISKKKARIFLVYGNMVTEQTEISSRVPKRHEQGGWAQARLQRRHDEAVGHHFKTTADYAFEIFQTGGFSRLLIAGPDELVSEFRDYLHPYLYERLAGSFPISMAASSNAIRERTQTIIHQIMEREIAELMDRLENEASAQEMGITGLRGTLQVLQRGQIQTLLVREGFAAPGKQCRHCDSLTLCEDSNCPYCGGSLLVRYDIVQESIDRALEQGCTIQMLNSAAGNRLAKLGDIGALLRFKLGE